MAKTWCPQDGKTRELAFYRTIHTAGEEWREETANGSARHAVELWKVERRDPLQPALGEHLELWLDQIGPVEAAEHHEDEAGEAFEIAGEQSRAARGAEAAIEPF